MSKIKHLDEALIDLLAESYDINEVDADEVVKRIDELIPQIRQAFKDDGYMKGGEFYKRFEDEIVELNKILTTDNIVDELRSYDDIGLSPSESIVTMTVTKLNQAVKRAAGMQ